MFTTNIKQANILYSFNREHINYTYTTKEFVEHSLKNHKEYTDNMLKAGFAFMGLGFAGLGSAMIFLYDKTDKIDDKITRLENKMDDKITRLENKMDDKITRLENKMDENFNKMESKMDDMEKNINKTNEIIMRFLYETNPKKAKDILHSK
jgi:peptidoglycan hydrolase CwlO-like protein